MLTEDFNFTFPEGQIALNPLPRGESRLLVVPKKSYLPTDFPLPFDEENRAFGSIADFINLLKPGDALVLNDTKVIRARLHGRLPSGSRCEILLLKPVGEEPSHCSWECMVRPGRKMVPGVILEFSSGLSAEVLDVLPEGERILRFNLSRADFFQILESVGEIPLPPYIRRSVIEKDLETYQSVFAENLGSVAAPTASLHLSQSFLDEATSKGVQIVKLTLHVGAGTFRPVQVESIEDHPMHTESFTLSPESAQRLNEIRGRGGRLFAVGTTAARVLETCSRDDGFLEARTGETKLFIYPGYKWKAVDALLTNFHWPKSTLFMLVCGMMGTEKAQAAYAEAIGRGFRLFSYGDAMLIL